MIQPPHAAAATASLPDGRSAGEAHPPTSLTPPQDTPPQHAPALDAQAYQVVPRSTVLQASLLAQVKQKVSEKGVPYATKAGFPGVFLNAEVSVFSSNKRPQRFQQTVFCRHFATMFAQHAGKKSELLGPLSTEAGVRNQFDGVLHELDIAYYGLIREAPPGCKHVVSSEHLGQYLAALASTLQAPQQGVNQPHEVNCLLITVDHAMALHVRLKSKAGMDYIAATLYDPNDTAHYKRVEQPTPQGFSAIKLQDMLVSPELLSLYAGAPDRPLAMAAVSLDHRVQAPFDRSIVVPSIDNMHVALTHGVVDDVGVMFEAARHQQTAAALYELLAATPQQDNTFPGLYRAFQRGHTACIAAFGTLVLAADEFDRQAKVQLLSASNDDGTAGLYLAMDDGDTQTVQVFAQLVLNSAVLTDADKVYLLTAQDGNGHPGLFAAVRADQADTVRVFVQSVLASDLNMESKESLLKAETDFGDAGFYDALQEGRVKVIQAMVESVLEAPTLSPEAKVRLLESKVYDVPSLAPCFQYGYDPSVRAFADAVLASPDLDEGAKVSLMAALNEVGVPGLHAAFRNGHTETVEAFVACVLRSDLTAAAKGSLLAALDADGVSGLSAAREEGHIAAANAFCELVGSSALPADVKDQLMRA